MPRFSLSSPPPPFSSPSSGMPFGESSSEVMTPTSVKLSCLSPDGRAVHSLVTRRSMAMIETHPLPLLGTVDGGDDDRDAPQVIRTRLPDDVCSALQRYPAMELLCVDVDTEARGWKKLPRLCLYTKKDVFLLELQYDTMIGDREGQGRVVAVTSPFDSLLIGNATSTNIVRIRQAPQQHNGYMLLCPAEAMAMLTHDTAINEYTLSLFHGKTSPVSTPLVYATEQLEEPMERITDFCFCQSSSFGLLSNLSVALLKASGEVLQASPILFRGTVVSQDAVTEALEYIEAQMARHDATTARGRQYRVARQYIVDCFPMDKSRGRFVTGQERSAAFEWPAQMQGPVLLLPESDDLETLATSIEPMAAGDLCGLAIGHVGYKVEFGLLSPTLFVPRFQLEHREDTMKLDQDLKWGAIVNRVDLRDDDNERIPSSSYASLIRDPVMDSVVHYVTSDGIQSVSTNALKVTANNMVPSEPGVIFSPPSKRRDIPPRTTGWSCFEVSHVNGPTAVVGAVVSGDVQFGHVLVARLSNGSMIAINLTETRQIQEMEAINDSTTEKLAIKSQAATNASVELQALHDTPPLVDIAKPLMEKTIEGIRGMGKIVGSVTPVDKITPELLTVAAQVKEQTDKDIILPIMELNEHIRARKQDIVVMFNNQMTQLQTLRKMIAQLKQGESNLAEKLEVITSNAESLAKRSASVLQAAHDLQPTITQAEFDYFQELQRLQDRTKQWNSQIDRLKLRATTLREASQNGTTGRKVGIMTIDEGTRQNLNAMLKASETRMKNYATRLKDAEYRVDELAAAVGWDRDPHGTVGLKQ